MPNLLRYSFKQGTNWPEVGILPADELAKKFRNAPTVAAVITNPEFTRLWYVLGPLSVRIDLYQQLGDDVPADADFDGAPALACPNLECQSIDVEEIGQDMWHCTRCGFRGWAGDFEAVEDPEQLLRQAGLNRGRP